MFSQHIASIYKNKKANFGAWTSRSRAFTLER